MNSNNPWLSWKLWLPLAFQSLIIVAIPAQSFYVLMTGKTVIFKTVPVDPYDFLRGYSQTLSYDISNLSTIEKLPGGREFKLAYNPSYSGQNEDVYLVLEPPKSTINKVPQPWRAVKVSRAFPKSIAPQEIVVKGRLNYGTIKYGLESYYMPESSREKINREIQEANWGKKREPIIVQAKVDRGGKAAIESFWIGDRHYQF